MIIPYCTLGMDRDGNVEILNVKCDPLLIGSLRGQTGFRPAYHMNKDKWITALLDGSAGREDIEMLLSISYELTLGSTAIRNKAKTTEDTQQNGGEGS